MVLDQKTINIDNNFMENIKFLLNLQEVNFFIDLNIVIYNKFKGY